MDEAAVGEGTKNGEVLDQHGFGKPVPAVQGTELGSRERTFTKSIAAAHQPHRDPEGPGLAWLL